jgi:hypothetical protein
LTNKFYFAPPGGGKSYVVTSEAVEYLDHGKSVLSNYPIVTPDGKCSRVWKPEYIYENIQDSLIIIDEAQVDFDSQEHKSLDSDEDAFFATSGQNGNEIRIVSQGITRVTKAVRDRMNEWVRVRVFLDIPFLRNARGKFGLPFYFSCTSWLSLEDMASQSKDRVYLHEFVRFKKRVGLSYDTVFFRNPEKPFIPDTWIDEIKKRGGDIERLTERSHKDRQKSFSAVAYRCFVPQRIKDTIHDLNLSWTHYTQRGKATPKNIPQNDQETVEDRILPESHDGR